MRKIKNFTLHIDTTAPVPLYFALVYIPQGTENGIINSRTVDNPISLYEPNQNVIMLGLVRKDSPQLTFRSRLARNLNSGDSIGIVFRAAFSTPNADEVILPADETHPDPRPIGYASYGLTVTLNYAITF